MGGGVGGTIYSVTQRAPIGGSSQGGGQTQQQADQHEQLEREPRRYVAPSSQHDQLVRATMSSANVVGGAASNVNSRIAGKDKSRNPTILRKSKLFVPFILTMCFCCITIYYFGETNIIC